MPVTVEPVDIEKKLADPATYEDAILRVFAKRQRRGVAFSDAGFGVTYFSAATERQALSAAIARSVATGRYQPQPVDLWFLESKGKRYAAHKAAFTDHVIASALFKLLTHNARCYGLPGVYSYLPGSTNLAAMHAFARFVRDHRKHMGANGPPLHVLQCDFERYGENLPVGPDAALWHTLRSVAALGSVNGQIAPAVWNLITSLVRPVVRQEDGTLFTRLNGVAMGTPLVPVVGNLAVVAMDEAICSIDGIFYARYNDDFIIAHRSPSVLREAEMRIDALLTGLGVKRKVSKEVRTALSGTGLSSVEDPAYRGRDRIDCLGLTVGYAGTVSVGPNRLRRFVGRVATRLDGIAPALSAMPVIERARHLVAATNAMLDVANPFAVAGLSALLDTTTDRGVLKDLDYRIARKIVQVATQTHGVRGFRQVPPAVLRGDMGLVSLVHLRNLR